MYKKHYYPKYKKTNYRYKKYQNRQFYQNPPSEHSFLIKIFSGIGNLILAPFKKRGVSFSEKKIIISKWYYIRKLISENNESSLKSAIIEADKLMDFGLKSARFSGNRFAERLKAAKTYFPRKIYSGIWEAHILRNEIVHNIDNRLTLSEAKKAVHNFYQGLKYLKAL